MAKYQLSNGQLEIIHMCLLIATGEGDIDSDGDTLHIGLSDGEHSIPLAEIDAVHEIITEMMADMENV